MDSISTGIGCGGRLSRGAPIETRLRPPRSCLGRPLHREAGRLSSEWTTNLARTHVLWADSLDMTRATHLHLRAVRAAVRVRLPERQPRAVLARLFELPSRDRCRRRTHNAPPNVRVYWSIECKRRTASRVRLNEPRPEARRDVKRGPPAALSTRNPRPGTNVMSSRVRNRHVLSWKRAPPGPPPRTAPRVGRSGTGRGGVSRRRLRRAARARAGGGAGRCLRRRRAAVAGDAAGDGLDHAAPLRPPLSRCRDRRAHGFDRRERRRPRARSRRAL